MTNDSTQPAEYAEPTEWTLDPGERVPTLREQIEAHLGLAHKSAKEYPDRMAMHLAIAAGVGLASTTLDDLDDLDAAEAADEASATFREVNRAEALNALLLHFGIGETRSNGPAS